MKYGALIFLAIIFSVSFVLYKGFGAVKNKVDLTAVKNRILQANPGRVVSITDGPNNTLIVKFNEIIFTQIVYYDQNGNVISMDPPVITPGGLHV